MCNLSFDIKSVLYVTLHEQFVFQLLQTLALHRQLTECYNNKLTQ
jgi:hypothetical protein